MEPSLVILSSPINNLSGLALKYHHLEITPLQNLLKFRHNPAKYSWSIRSLWVD